MSHTVIFDIGKTNKKCFVFDKELREVHRSYRQIPEAKDPQGFPCEDRQALESWMWEALEAACSQYAVSKLNFSTYGASLVHLNDRGSAITPIYNYLKPFPESLKKQFWKSFGPASEWCRATASPALGMLNASWQLYWLKHQNSETFAQIRTSLHLPQYVSYLFSGKTYSDFTSVGCHTGLWDFDKETYHDWITESGLRPLFPQIVASTHSIPTRLFGQNIEVGVGIHDSSAALLPYLQAQQEPFMLISTGTWSITLNPFCRSPLTLEELESDCLHYLGIHGQPVKASRLFLGQEFKIQVKKLHEQFDLEYGVHRQMHLNAKWVQQYQSKDAVFSWEFLPHQPQYQENEATVDFPCFEAAYHKLVMELTDLQVRSVRSAQGATKIRHIFVDGGFVDNDLYLKLLALKMPDMTITAIRSPLGSALGAAWVMGNHKPEHLSHHLTLSPIQVPVL
ncbi:FGGY family carbohydrate kinase [Pontibacter sp. G13]|uniref:FGGY family carbohydrate kinase n=1 Tax=Pontibacter sp. G13 TaxID=3074898 RepID=UPI00288C35BA|nr:FGGY family carbohydrate kinase [Pontibacter sp. G13]WNJ19020.1 FGGY family carbohydrate kinase [Pontibacter sp. G13]